VLDRFANIIFSFLSDKLKGFAIAAVMDLPFEERLTIKRQKTHQPPAVPAAPAGLDRLGR